MACLNPIRAWRHKLSSNVLWRQPSDATISYYTPNPIPCGQCRGCKLEYSRQWAVRMTLESSLHTHNYFLTLSYHPDHLPNGATLVKKHLQDFHKRLRIYYERTYKHYDIRYYCCGEYGEKKGRPHYHGIYFNLPIFDLEHQKNNYAGDPLYTSKTINDIWGKGLCWIGNVTFNTCGYVSRYVTKKVDSYKHDKNPVIGITKPNAIDGKVLCRMEWRTSKGEIKHYTMYKNCKLKYKNIVRIPEFSLMSRNPAIGFRWFEKYWHETYRDDYIVLNGKKLKPPKYFDNLMREACKDVYPEYWDKVKQNRIDNRPVYDLDYYDVRLKSIRKAAAQRFKRLIRVIEKDN